MVSLALERKINLKRHFSRKVDVSVKWDSDEYAQHNSFRLQNGPLYTVRKDFSPANSLSVSGQKLPFLELRQGDLVSLISYEEDHMCCVKLVNEIGIGMVPLSYLEEDEKINKLMSMPANIKYGSLVSFTPPTSPSTISSMTFSEASSSRSCSTSSLESQTPSRESTSIDSCNVTKVELRKNRLVYTISVRYANSDKFSIERHYDQFYRLHAKLLSIISDTSEIPPLPQPVGNPMNEDEKLDRAEQLSSYLKKLLVFADGFSSYSLFLLVHNWIVSGTLDTTDVGSLIKIKLHYNHDCYAIKPTADDLKSLDHLKKLVLNKLKSSTTNSTMTITAKIGGWYIVELANEQLYQEVLRKAFQEKKLLLDVKSTSSIAQN